MTESKQKNLLQGAVGQRPQTTVYYATALERLDKKENPWNWASALLGPYWLLYHRAFFLFWCGIFVMSACQNAVLWLIGGRGLVVAASIAPQKLYREFLAGNDQIPLLIFSFAIVNFLLWTFLWGRFGNRILFWSLRRREKAGYFALPSYRSTERGWMVCVLLLLFICSVCVAEVRNLVDKLENGFVSLCTFGWGPLLSWVTRRMPYAASKLDLLGPLLGNAFAGLICYLALVGLTVFKIILAPLREWNQLRQRRLKGEFLRELENLKDLTEQ